ncbi:DUF882 domain-containing protein [Microvirga makkahensis]|uniref:Murein endopeptidase K n=1 Tax=Microvirga makkahensis TaxID=1128670 RepID=A0A7X3SR44_9HYPH|nr:DUF882 domain-containing protein [Microvirga makkahensis]MXQ14177.1 DUF882 domain-containing protein [Microvirga makkahensis]
MARPKRSLGKHHAVHVLAENCRRNRKKSLNIAYILAGAVGLLAFYPWNLTVHASGETRTLSFVHTHRQDSLTVTFRRNGRYDEQALGQLNWFLRDWRNDKPARMDPRLFDVLWEVYQESGSRQPIHIISSYRSPETNSALRRRSSGVAENSQHMLGKAMDIRLPDVPTARLREIAMRLQYGGVGYYGSSDFVHVDTGSVRAWPRMSQQQLARLFPDGRTAHLPANGRPLPGYEQARVQIAARNAALAQQASAGGGSIGSLLANVFGRKTQSQPQAPVQQPIVVASAVPENVASPAPLPPQRPQDLVRQVAVAQPPMPPARITDVSPVMGKATATFEPILGYNVKAAVRSLFEPKTALLDMRFSPGSPDDLNTARFTGPAIKPLPRLEQQQGPGTLWAKAG